MNIRRLLSPFASAAAALWLVSLDLHAQSAGSSVTVYGVADAGVEMSRSGNGNVTRLVSGGALGSRVGFRGTEDLGGGLSAQFRLEQGLTLDDGQLGQGGRMFGREASVGLSRAGFGTVLLGRLPTPYYVVQSGVDAFAWMGSGGLLSLSRSGAASRQVLPNAVNARHDNSVTYASPRFGGIELRALISAGEGSASIGRGYSASARYSEGGLDFALGLVRQEGASNSNGYADGLVAGGSYDFGMARLFAGFSAEKNSCVTCAGALARVTGVTATGASEFKLINLGVRVPMGNLTGIAQVVRVNDDSQYSVDPGSRDATWFALGAEYTFSRRTLVYTSIGTIGNRNGSQYALGSGTAQQPGGFIAAGDPRSTTAIIGMRHMF